MNKLTNTRLLYAPVSVVRCKSTKVTIIRAKSHTFMEFAKGATAQLVAHSTGFYPAFTHSSERSMYQ